MAKQNLDQPRSYLAWYRNLSKSKKVILIVMSIWAAQAIPKWTAAITADGELSAKIMKVFIEPRGIDR